MGHGRRFLSILEFLDLLARAFTKLLLRNLFGHGLNTHVTTRSMH